MHQLFSALLVRLFTANSPRMLTMPCFLPSRFLLLQSCLKVLLRKSYCQAPRRCLTESETTAAHRSSWSSRCSCSSCSKYFPSSSCSSRCRLQSVPLLSDEVPRHRCRAGQGQTSVVFGNSFRHEIEIGLCVFFLYCQFIVVVLTLLQGGHLDCGFCVCLPLAFDLATT